MQGKGLNEIKANDSSMGLAVCGLSRTFNLWRTLRQTRNYQTLKDTLWKEIDLLRTLSTE